jgi:hypothetical protein
MVIDQAKQLVESLMSQSDGEIVEKAMKAPPRNTADLYKIEEYLLSLSKKKKGDQHIFNSKSIYTMVSEATKDLAQMASCQELQDNFLLSVSATIKLDEWVLDSMRSDFVNGYNCCYSIKDKTDEKKYAFMTPWIFYFRSRITAEKFADAIVEYIRCGIGGGVKATDRSLNTKYEGGDRITIYNCLFKEKSTCPSDNFIFIRGTYLVWLNSHSHMGYDKLIPSSFGQSFQDRQKGFALKIIEESKKQ